MAAEAADTVGNITSPPIAAPRSSQYHFAESPKSPHQPRQPAKPATSAWSHVAHGESQPVVAAAPPVEPAVGYSSSSASSSTAGDEVGTESGTGANGGAGKRVPWNKPSNGPGPEAAGPVIGADSWPALSASPKRSSRKSSSESAKVSSDGSSSVSAPASQGSGNASSAAAAASSSSSSSQRQLNSHGNTHLNVNNQMPLRQRSMKGNNGSATLNGDAPQSPGPRNPSLDSQSIKSSPRDDSQRSGSASENHGGHEHQQQQRNSFKTRSGGTYQRGDGSHSQSYANRRDQDRTNQEWNPRGFNHNRDARMHQQQRGYPRYGRVSHPAAPVIPPVSGQFIPLPQPRHFAVPPMGGYNDMAPPVYVLPFQHPVNFVSPMPPHMVNFQPPDPNLYTKIIDQINYYFSNDNLVKDTYLRQNMDEQGWVPVALIASFKKILQLTNNTQLILDVVRNSPMVEVQGDKLRRRNDWGKWIMLPAIQFPEASGARSTVDSVATSVQTLSLDERTGNSDTAKAEAARADTSIGTSN
ncbi:hypothetical protein CDL15_Pgr004716 [Punica granatum]|uniref:HTH La-type RNA-binding domain-containing protein n=1 Tax=Punica granatum TaxID=22663 RepID=A0A218W5T1_PUNGR|nr:hypothetical protein CDL15_Pgr004716 [Punica granatum]